MSGTYRTFEDVRNTVVRELRSVEQNLLAGIASDEDEGNLMWVEADFVDMLKMVYEQIDVSIGNVLYARGLRPTPGNEDVTSEPVEPTIGGWFTPHAYGREAESDDDIVCDCQGKCNRDCPCMNIDCDDDDCGNARGCLDTCQCAGNGECD
jgi:hypothetical protein